MVLSVMEMLLMGTNPLNASHLGRMLVRVSLSKKLSSFETLT